MADETPPVDPANPEPKLVEMHLDDSGLAFTVSHPIVGVIANHLASAFKASGATNFVSMEIHHPELGTLEMVMRRKNGVSAETLSHRYRETLEKIVKRFPCSTIRDMRRVAAEALGIPVPEMNND